MEMDREVADLRIVMYQVFNTQKLIVGHPQSFEWKL